MGEVRRGIELVDHFIRTDEPFVVLDTSSDWRFENNPNVVGPNSIRFYAGAPLRTADGFNVGALCILDDKPRTEFPPRSRLILKEFAVVTMREMELWRDKVGIFNSIFGVSKNVVASIASSRQDSNKYGKVHS